MTLGWALLIVVLVVLLFASEAFRKVALVILGLIVLAAFLLYAWLDYSARDNKRKREIAKTYIKRSEVEIVEPRISLSSYDRRPERFIGRLRNNSAYPVQEIEVRLVFKDCPSAGDCEIVGEQNESIYIDVPPGQSRDFEEYVSGMRFNARGKLEWSYEITAIVARVD